MKSLKIFRISEIVKVFFEQEGDQDEQCIRRHGRA